MQSAPIALKSLRRKECDFEPRSIGDHIRQHRLRLGLGQKAFARTLKVTQFSIINWERGHTQPTRPSVLRRIVDFLSYDPDPPAGVATLPDRLRAKRRQMGWGQRELAKALGVDGSTVTRWEQGRTILKHAHRASVAQLLGLSAGDLAALLDPTVPAQSSPLAQAVCTATMIIIQR